MSRNQSTSNPFQLYFTFGIVAAISIIMNSFVGTGLAIWYPTLIKPEWTIPLSFTYIISIFFQVMFGIIIYLAYTKVNDVNHKWTGFFGMILFVILHELANVLLYSLESVVLHFALDMVVFFIGVYLFYFLWKKMRLACYFFIPFFLWSIYNLPWSFYLMQLNT